MMKKNNFYNIPLCTAGGFYFIQNATFIIIEQMEYKKPKEENQKIDNKGTLRSKKKKNN